MQRRGRPAGPGGALKLDAGQQPQDASSLQKLEGQENRFPPGASGAARSPAQTFVSAR